MKKISLLIILVVVFFKTFAQDIKTIKFNSEQLNADRYLKIYVPPSYELDSTKLYPLTSIETQPGQYSGIIKV